MTSVWGSKLGGTKTKEGTYGLGKPNVPPQVENTGK
jgi:hypothetical protein